jgi:DNA-binding winged helix-turn-helix (wHTH) protein/tetratricopeptide (TPR) repeat protein
MPLKTKPAGTLRFGAFELDLRAGELRKKGLRIRLQEQPLQVLTVLLQHPGELVTREELRSEIWTADTFVDFDNGLNTAVNKLRDALGDSSANPRFIETVPRRGYRFIAPVTRNRHKDYDTASTAVLPAQSRKTVAQVTLLLIAVLLAGGLIWRRWPARHLTEKRPIVLGDFANSTGDGVFDGTLRQGLSVQLQQSPYLRLVSEEQIHQTLRRMGQRTNARLTPEIIREICQRSNSAIALDGAIALIGTRYDLVIKAVDCTSGDLLASAEAQANDKSHVLDALGNVASEIRRKLGESLGALHRYNTPLPEATTSSLEALQSYSLGVQTEMQTGNFADSLPWFRRAIELDPNFAMAYWALGDAASVVGDSNTQAASVKKAFELRAGVSEWERLMIEGDYYYYVTGDLTQARRTFELVAQLYPDNVYAYNVLGAVSNTVGQYEAGLHEYQEGLRLTPFSTIFYRDVAYTDLLLDRVDQAEAAAQQAHTAGLDADLGPILYQIAFYRDDYGGMTRQVASGVGRPGVEDLLLALDADTAAFSGQLLRARELSRRAADSAERAGEKESAAGYYAASALREALFGDADQARKQAVTAKQRATGRDIDYGIALALAYAGDVNRAQALTEDLEKNFPEDTLVKVHYLPTLRAKLTLHRSSPHQALNILQAAAPYELGLPAYSFYNWPNLYPVYVRGEAYLAAHQGSEAIVEFQKILDHRGIVLNGPIGALAHLQLGRAYAMSRDNLKARAAYRAFLDLWRNADPDIPILKQAKTEYTKLP